MNNKIIILIIILIVTIVGYVGASYVSKTTLHGSVVIETNDGASVEFYENSSCTISLNSIDFGTINLDGEILDGEAYIYIKNTGTGTITHIKNQAYLQGYNILVTGSQTANLGPGESMRLQLILGVPLDIDPGIYPVVIDLEFTFS